MLRKTAILISSLMILGCGGKKKDEAPAPTPKPAEMTEVAMAETPKVDPPKVEEPKVEEPKIAEEDKLPVEAVAAEVAGTVEVKKAGSDAFVALVANAELAVGDHLRVSGENGMLKMRMWDDSMVSLGTGAEAVINPGADVANSSPSITLLTGTSNLMVEPRAKDQSVFLVYTPAAIFSVLGTEFDVGIADSGTVKLGVGEGLVQVVSQEGANLLDVPQGKAVVITLEGTTSKAAAPVAYDAEKEDWAVWYEAENKAAAARVDFLTKATTTRLEEMRKQMEALDKSIAEMEARSAELIKKAEEASAKNDVKVYETESAPLVEVLEDNTVANQQNQRLVALMTANAYLLHRLQAMIAAGVIKPTAEQQKVIVEANANVEAWLPDYEENNVDRLRRRHKRDRAWRETYLRHSPRGREFAIEAKIEMPEFYVKLPKMDPRKPRVAVKPRPIPVGSFIPGTYKGPARKDIVIRPVTPNWHAARPYTPADPTRLERQRKLMERMRRHQPKTPVVVVVPPKFRHRRSEGTGPMVPPALVDPALPMGPEDGMGHDGMGPRGRGPRCKGPHDMSPECMEQDDMGPMMHGMLPVVVPPAPGVIGPMGMIPPMIPGPVPAPVEPRTRHKRDM